MMKILAALLICFAASAAIADITELPKLAQADNAFAFDLLKQIAAEQPGQNIFISPYSVSSVLQTVVNGAAGKTRTEIMDVLRTSDIPSDELNTNCMELNQSLLAQSDVDLELANSIWYQTGLQLKPTFLSIYDNFFQGQLAAVDFKSPAAADLINDWASKNTHGKITGVVSYPFPEATRLILANAIYFKGKWADPFDTNLTQPRNFYLPDNTVQQPPMMSQEKKFDYQEGGGFQAVGLPYAGQRLEMYLFLPATNSSPEKLLKSFSGKNWSNEILPGFAEREGTVTFPKFKLNYLVSLVQPLESLGMNSAFDPRSADFSALADEPLFIGAATQKSYVDVDEQGTEAAAVTVVTFGATAIENPQPPFEMLVNRPFFFVIADNDTRAILFMGIVDDPAP